MKQGLQLAEVAQEIQNQAQLKRDFVVNTNLIHMNQDTSLSVATSEKIENFTATAHTLGQIAQRLNIPAKYFQLMQKEAPELLASNVNHWFQHQPESRMIRTLQSSARAYLSNKYRRIDNYEIAEGVLPILSEFGDSLFIASIGLTESKMYIKAVNQKMQLDVKVGDAVQAGVMISNSEIGLGSLRIEPLVFRLSCLNGMIVPEHGLKKYHVGRVFEEIEDSSYEIFSDETKEAEDKALLLKVRDMVKAATSQALFTQIVSKMQESVQQPIGNPVKAVEILGDKFSMTLPERSGILTHLIQGGDLSAYGLLNAVTRTSQDLDDYDRATTFEVLGSQILSLPPSTWKEIALA